jgi:hypothetical protein
VIESIANLQKISDDFSRKFRGLEPLKRPLLMPNEAIPRKVDINAEPSRESEQDGAQ